MPWQNQDLAELYRVRDRLCASGLSVEVEGGVSDEGDPWFIYQQAGTDMVVVHIARIDTNIHVVNCITGTTYTGSTFREVSDRMLDDAPVVLGARVRRASNVVMHPSAFLTAFVAAALMLLDAPGEAKADEAPATAAGDPAHVPSHAPEAGHRAEAGDSEATLPTGSAATCVRRGQKEGPSLSGLTSLSHVHLAEMAISASMTLSAGLLTNELMHLLRPDEAAQGHEIDVSLLAFFVTSSEALLGSSRSAQDAPKAAAAIAPVLVKAEAHHGVDGIDLHEPNLAGSLPGPQAPKLNNLHLEAAASGVVELPTPRGQFGALPTVVEAGSQPSGGAGMAASGKVETPAPPPEKEANAASAAAAPVATGVSQEPAHVASVSEVSATGPTVPTTTPAASPAATLILSAKVDLALVKATWISATDALPSALAKGSAADDKSGEAMAAHPATDKMTDKLVEGDKLTVTPVDDSLASALLPRDTATSGLSHVGVTIVPAITDAVPTLAPVAEVVPRVPVAPVVDTDIHHLVGADAITLVAGRRDVIHYSSTAHLVLDGFVMGEDVIMFADEATGNSFSAMASQIGDDLVMSTSGGDTVRLVGVLADVAHHLPAVAA